MRERPEIRSTVLFWLCAVAMGLVLWGAFSFSVGVAAYFGLLSVFCAIGAWS